jgi:endonuclease YncB( thermonuclease family)
MIRLEKKILVLAILVLAAGWPLVLCAEVVKEISSDGTLTLESGKQVVLAGIKMDTEGVSVLRVLAQKQDLRLQLLANSASGGKESAYAYLQTKYVKFPAKLGEASDEREILLNEFLVKIGAAKVIETQEFRRKADFLKVQEEARKKGEGVWSYEAS